MMDAVIWGVSSALSFGSADFIARFTSRRIGTERALLWVLAIGLLPIAVHLILSGTAVSWPGRTGGWLVATYGLGTALATLLLYEALARGPITVVAPIVGTYPALVVVLALLNGRGAGALQLLATTAVLAGAWATARFADEDRSNGVLTRTTLAIAVAASLAYAVLVAAGQAAVPVLGDAQTALGGRIVAIAAVLVYAGLRYRPKAAGGGPKASVCGLVGLQGILDGGGHLLLFAGSHGAHPEVAAVAGSCFGAVTTLLAYFILRERVSWKQWVGIAVVFAGIACLSILA